MDPLTASDKVTQAGLKPKQELVPCEPGPNGTTAPCTSEQISKVIRTNPVEGTSVLKGSEVIIQVGSPPGEAGAPDLQGKTPQDAQAILDKDPNGFKLVQSTETIEVDDTSKVGKVAQQNPSPGVKLKKGGTITVQLGRAPDKQNVPSVVGDNVEDAKQTLEGSGFKVSVELTDSAKQQNQVISQTPAGNSKAAKDSLVVLKVSKGNLIEMPDLQGLSAKDAETRLKALGWNGNFNTQDQTVTDESQVNNVLSQQPTKGTAIAKGATVTVNVGKKGSVIPTG